MTQTTPPRRAYQSAYRQEQARETRMQILEAARKLFIRHGYAGATIEAIAQEAGVAAETVFAIFGNKRTILARLVEVSVGGDDQPVPLLQRSGPQAVLQEHDPARQLTLFAQDITTILARVAPVFEILRMAAKTEADIAELLKKLLQERFKNLAAFVQSVSAHVSLRQGLGQVRAAEIVWTLTSPEVFSLLTRDRGWSQEQYAAWLAESLRLLLME